MPKRDPSVKGRLRSLASTPSSPARMAPEAAPSRISTTRRRSLGVALLGAAWLAHSVATWGTLGSLLPTPGSEVPGLGSGAETLFRVALLSSLRVQLMLAGAACLVAAWAPHLGRRIVWSLAAAGALSAVLGFVLAPDLASVLGAWSVDMDLTTLPATVQRTLSVSVLVELARHGLLALAVWEAWALGTGRR